MLQARPDPACEPHPAPSPCAPAAVESTKAAATQAAQSTKEAVTGVRGLLLLLPLACRLPLSCAGSAAALASRRCSLGWQHRTAPAVACLQQHLTPTPPSPFLPLAQLPEAVRQTYARGQELARERDAEGVVCVPASAVQPGAAQAQGAGGGAGTAGLPAEGTGEPTACLGWTLGTLLGYPARRHLAAPAPLMPR